jgi:hypothetical protein
MQLTSDLSARLSAVVLATSPLVVANFHTPRQSNGVSIGDACFAVMLKDGVLDATCVALDISFKDTSIDLNQCLTNDHGVLKFTTRYLDYADTSHVSAMAF